jgi:DNA segregation ATPase FtsK/SpoIIIE-like protein
MDLGYTRASKVVEALEKAGLLGPLTESGSREVLLTREQWQSRPRAD